MTTALFLGRFQPVPHNGHVRVIQDILHDHDRIIIGLGSAQYAGTDDDMLTVEERREVFERLFDSLGIAKDQYTIIAIPDIHDNEKYVAHVSRLVPHFDVVHSGNELVQRLFRKAGRDVVELPRYDGISGTNIRKSMRAEDGEWRRMVPEVVLGIIEKL